MAKLSKKRKQINDQIDTERLYGITEACESLKSLPVSRFVESVDVSINLGIDPRKSNQVVRGSTALPHGTGKTVRIAVFAEGQQAEQATAAGADKVGLEDLAEDMKKGDLNYDVVIASPDTMRVVGKLGQLLGPKGLMPNPKVGTVATDLAAAVTGFKSGKVRYRADKGGSVQASIGKINFETSAIIENLESLVADLKKQKPAAAKGIYLRKIVLSTTIGPGLQINLSSLA